LGTPNFTRSPKFEIISYLTAQVHVKFSL
ncbi:uncharacterized protein METZ01_LOCUS186775, partial [marine metagenome]